MMVFKMYSRLQCLLCFKSHLLYRSSAYNGLNFHQRFLCTKVLSMHDYVDDKIRNFSIIAHIDHGKSTLADRLLEFTGTIKKSATNKQVLDKLQVERERGITVKAQTSSMFYNVTKSISCLFNLIDTPGHVDFGYEVSRSLAACQGALLVVDAAQGVQAQTVANFFKAIDAGLTIVPVINKIDLASANVANVCKQMESTFDVLSEEIIKVSAKEGIGIDKLLQAIYERVPSPKTSVNEDLSLFLFDSWYDVYRGVINLVTVKNGKISKGDKLQSVHSGATFECLSLGILHPDECPVNTLYAGQVGYIVTGIRDINQTLIGDTFHHVGKPVKPTPGFKQPTPMVFSGIYPPDQDSYIGLKKAMEKLCLNDSSVSMFPDNSAALGQGWRVGFMGLLHMDVFRQRLLQEYNADIIVTTPNVPYQATLKTQSSDVRKEIRSPQEFENQSKVNCYFEPVVIGTLVFPEQYLGKIIELCENKRGQQLLLSYIDDSRVLLKYRLPLNEIVIDFFDLLKSVSSGYASFDYEDGGYIETDIEKMEIWLNGKPVDALSTIVHKTKCLALGKSYCFKLKETIPRQLFEVVIQAAVRNKVIARETIQPLRKDVTAKCYGGDITRKRKLLEQQKEGKKKLKRLGNVDVPHNVFLSLLKL
ncbi:translation factor GUF1 homolog, mitochondrial isoform X3 [Hydra vulgaris]|uniref:Translation factor GUF1 homolog, mitochondrial n=1 Tax=Hydra vulgaris TaxID=6087 RepID=A0ABM4D6G5_HYDVU